MDVVQGVGQYSPSCHVTYTLSATKM